MQVVAKLASPTGQWPEAIHPHTLGGCMGDGQHVWAAAEWLMAMRNMFVREEYDSLIIGSGIPANWHYSEARLSYGPTWTPWGKLEIAIDLTSEQGKVCWRADWNGNVPDVRVAVPGFHAVDCDMSAPSGSVRIRGAHQCVTTSAITTVPPIA
jgi:hypothetical protein